MYRGKILAFSCCQFYAFFYALVIFSAWYILFKCPVNFWIYTNVKMCSVYFLFIWRLNLNLSSGFLCHFFSQRKMKNGIGCLMDLRPFNLLFFNAYHCREFILVIRGETSAIISFCFQQLIFHWQVLVR